MPGDALFVTLGSFALLILAYFIYGRFLARRIFQLDPNRRTPAHTMYDGVDYVPTRVPVLFGHHFASIAGLGPILGPAIAVIWGWVPAVLWVVFGCIFMGAVHDLGALTVSLRFKGRSIGDVCRELIGPRARLLFLVIIFFAMSLAMGAFVSTISDLFVLYRPDAIIPSFGLMAVAVIIGIAVYRFRVRLFPATLLGLVAFAALIGWGAVQPVTSYDWFVSAETQSALHKARETGALTAPHGANAARKHFEQTEGIPLVSVSTLGLLGSPLGQGPLLAATELFPDRPTGSAPVDELNQVLPSKDAIGPVKTSWILVLLAYGFIASVLPVWLLLQPRDYINSFQLYFALFFLFIGLLIASFLQPDYSTIHSSAVRTPVAEMPVETASASEFQMPGDIYRPLLPFLFVTIACGAVSGFHSLVASGTTVKQMNRETDALPVGYGGMLMEGALAILVIMACVAGLGVAGWSSTGPYASWGGITGGGLATQLKAVVDGGANFLSMVGIPVAFGGTFLAVTIVAFALTTLDSGTRLLRFNIEELFRSIKAEKLANRYFASLLAVCGIALFGLLPAGRTLWILFGTTNQLLAGLTLLTVSVFLFKLNRPVVYTLVPMALMLTFTIWAMMISLEEFWIKEQWLLFSVASGILGISLWLMVEAGMSFARGRGGLTFEEEKTTEVKDKELETVSS